LAKPVVDRLEQELQGQVQVLRLSVADDVGGQLAVRYGARGVPTFVLLNGTGKVVFQQGGMPDREAIKSAVEELLNR
jgi:thioredoxin-related protein